MNKTDERINRRLEGYGRNVRWTHWVTNDGLECNDTSMHHARRELTRSIRSALPVFPQLEDENFGCNDCEGIKPTTSPHLSNTNI
jgi:hypothetical protein